MSDSWLERLQTVFQNRGRILVSSPQVSLTLQNHLLVKSPGAAAFSKEKSVTASITEGYAMVIWSGISCFEALTLRCKVVLALKQKAVSTFSMEARYPELKLNDKICDMTVEQDQGVQQIQVDIVVPAGARYLDLQLCLGQGDWTCLVDEWRYQRLYPRMQPILYQRDKPIVLYTKPGFHLDHLAAALWLCTHLLDTKPLHYFVDQRLDQVLARVKTMQMFGPLSGVLVWDCSDSFSALQRNLVWVSVLEFDSKSALDDEKETINNSNSRIMQTSLGNLWEYKLVRDWMLSQFGLSIFLRVRSKSPLLGYALDCIVRQTSRLWHLYIQTQGEEEQAEAVRLVRERQMTNSVTIETACHLNDHLNGTRAVLCLDESFLLVPSCVSELTREIANCSVLTDHREVRLEHFLTRLDPEQILSWDVKADVMTSAILECGRLHRSPCQVCRRGFSNRLMISFGATKHIKSDSVKMQPVNSNPRSTVWAFQIPT